MEEVLTPSQALLDATVQLARTENQAPYHKTLAAHEFWDHCVNTAIDTPGGDPGTVQYSAIIEIGVALGLSRRSADVLINVGGELYFRFPAVRDAFADGAIDYPRVATIISVLGHACDTTVAAAQDRLVGLAHKYTPGPLRQALWRLWFTINPDEAKAARDQNQKTSRSAYVRSDGNGLAWLTACITDLEGAEAQRLIDEIADTVCAADPRSVNERRADGLMALLHGESVLPCRCTQPDCVMAGIEAPQRRKYLVQILIDIQTLLGLSNTPATLDDGTPLPAEIGRILATDANWQAILTELAGLIPVMQSKVHNAAEIPAREAVVPTTSPVQQAKGPAEAKSAARPLGDPYTYRPSPMLARLVRAMYPTCTAPGCTVPSHKCELDHVVAFNHEHPELGGLTVLWNLQPVCKAHHQLKTKGLWHCYPIRGGVQWISPNGLRRTTRAENLPANLAPNKDTEPHRRDGSAHAEDPDLDVPSWWETQIGADTPGPTLRDINTATDPATRTTLKALRKRYIEHQHIEALRDRNAPPPF